MIVEKNILNEIKSLFPIQLLHIPYFFFPRLTNCRRATQKRVRRNQQNGTKCFHFIKVLKSTIDNSHVLIYSLKKNLAKLLFTPKAMISKDLSVSP